MYIYLYMYIYMTTSMYKCPLFDGFYLEVSHFRHSEPVTGAPGCRKIQKNSLSLELPKYAALSPPRRGGTWKSSDGNSQRPDSADSAGSLVSHSSGFPSFCDREITAFA